MTDKKEPKAKAVEKETSSTPDAVELIVAEPVKKPYRQERNERTITATEKVAGKTELVIVEKGPTVTIFGRKLTPKATGIKLGGHGDCYTVEGREFYLPHPIQHNQFTFNPRGADDSWKVSNSTNYAAPEMSYFVFVYEKHTFHLLLDEHSSFTWDKDEWFRATRGGQLILINSISRNDEIVNDVTLNNIESERCTFNNTVIAQLSSRPGKEYGWDEAKIPFNQVTGTRLKLHRVRAKKSTLIDSEVATGNYLNTHLTKTTIRAGDKQNNKLFDVVLTNSRIAATGLNLDGFNGEDIEINSTGQVDIKGLPSLNKVNWNFSNIYITNKFAFTEIDYITRRDRAIQLIRTSPTNMQVTVGYREPLDIEIGTARHLIEGLLREALKKDPGKPKITAVAPLGYDRGFGFPLSAPIQPWTPPSPVNHIKDYMLNYVVDQIFSRIGVIQLLDDAQETINEVTNKGYEHYPDFHE